MKQENKNKAIAAIFGAFFVLFLGTGVLGQYSLQFDKWVGGGNCPEEHHYISYVYNGTPHQILQVSFPPQEYGSGIPCSRSLNASRAGHHVLLNRNGNEIPYFSQYNIPGTDYSYLYVFPEMHIHAAWGLLYAGDYYYEKAPFIVLRCKNGDCTKIGEYNATEWYKPNKIDQTNLVNNEFPDIWWANYSKRFQQFKLKKFEGSVQGTTITFCWELESYSHHGYRQDCGPFCPDSMHVDAPVTETIANICDTVELSCTETGATCPSPLVCDETSGDCIEPCPDHCIGYDSEDYACGTVPAGCPESACGALQKGTHCDAGICNQTTGVCECPQNCIVNPSTVACGEQLVSNDCLQHEPVCAPFWSDPLIGWKCSDIDTRCAKYTGITKCWSPEEIDCGEKVTAHNGNPEEMTGLYCDSFEDEKHELCDKTIPDCLPVLQKSEYPLKYLFDISVVSQQALWYNIWYKFRFDTSDTAPKILGFDIEDSSVKIFCFDCSQQPDSATAYSIISSQEPTSKEGLIRFEVSNNGLFGSQNYARVKLWDKINPGKTSETGNEKTDFAILKLNAGYSGKCVPEDRSFKGETGTIAAPKLNYDWSWGNKGYQFDLCETDQPNRIYCDSAQFTISLFDRLEKIKIAKENGEETTSLENFNVLLMKDGFTEDFLLDFKHYMLTSPLADALSWFTEEWSSYLNTTNISFSQEQITEPGTYNVSLEFSWESSKGIFFEGGDPTAKINVSFSKIEDANPMHPLYLMPVDARIGESAREGETVPNRNGYGITFTGDPLPLSIDMSTFVSASGTIETTELTEFEETNSPSRRGKILSVNLAGSVIFAPVDATPVVMKIQELNGTAQGYYSLYNGTEKVSLLQQQFVGTWTGIGSRKMNSTCQGFHNLPLYFQRADEIPKEGSCMERDADARGFYWSGIETDQTVFFESVLYTPHVSSMALLLQCENNNAQMVSPNRITSSSIHTLDLGFTKEQGITVSSLQEIIDGVKNEKICQYISPDNQKVTFFWDRSYLLNSLEGDGSYDYSRYDLVETEDLCTLQVQ